LELDGGMKFPIATRTDRAPSTIVEMIPGAWHLTRYFRDSHARSLTYLVSDVELIYSSRIATNLLAGERAPCAPMDNTYTTVAKRISQTLH